MYVRKNSQDNEFSSVIFISILTETHISHWQCQEVHSGKVAPQKSHVADGNIIVLNQRTARH